MSRKPCPWVDEVKPCCIGRDVGPRGGVKPLVLLLLWWWGWWGL